MRAKVAECNRKKAVLERDLAQIKAQFHQKDSVEKQLAELVEQIESLKERKVDEEMKLNKLGKENMEVVRQMSENQLKKVLKSTVSHNLTCGTGETTEERRAREEKRRGSSLGEQQRDR